MSIKLKGSSDGSVSFDAPADTSPSGSDITLVLPTTVGSAEQFLKNSGTAGTLEFSSMVETSTGVGIGTSSPSAKLHVKSTDSTQLVLERDGSSDQIAALILKDGSGDQNRISSSDSNLIFGTGSGNTERMKINSSGVTVSSGNLSMHSGGRIFVGNGGNAVNPMFANVSDTNTGIAFPSADTMLLSTGGSERLRIDSSGRVLIGKSSSISGGEPSNALLQVVGRNGAPTDLGRFAIARGNSATNLGSGAEVGKIYFCDNAGNTFADITANVDGTTGSNDYPGRLVFSTSADGGSSPTERMRIDSSGRVGIGTASAAQVLQVHKAASSDSYIHITNSTSGANSSDGTVIGLDQYANMGIWNHENTVLYFATNNTEKMRIDNSGNVFINRTSQRSGEKLSVDNNGQVAIFACTTNADHSNIQMIHAYAQGSNNATQISFQNHTATQVGSIKSTASATSFNTSSDHRLKENVVDLDGAVTRVKQLSPKRFNFIVNPETTVDGFLAHEAQTVVPEAVTGTHNEVDDDNNPVYQGIDQSKLVPLLTAALQEAIAKIETLETKVAALEAQ